MRDGKKEVKKRLKKSLTQLMQIENAGFLTEQDLNQFEKVLKFRKELSIVSALLAEESRRFDLVTIPALEDIIIKANYSTMLFDGQYCKIALIKIEPYPEFLLVFLDSTEKVVS